LKGRMVKRIEVEMERNGIEKDGKKREGWEKIGRKREWLKKRPPLRFE